MLSPTDYLEIIQGSRGGLLAAVLRTSFSVASFPYGIAVRFRNRYYDGHPASVRKVRVPVVSVGNLTLGGTGKTPIVAWLANWFLDRHIHVGLVSRGYRSGHAGHNDEAMQLARSLPSVPHVQNPNRVQAARELASRSQCQLLLLDDGFQHRKLHRDLDIVLIDAHCPFGMDRLFPRGTLREPASGLQRADAIVLTHADQVSESERQRIRSRIATLAPDASWSTCTHAPQYLQSFQGERRPPTSLAGRRVAAFCGIGNPQAFHRTLGKLNCEIVAFRHFPDHHPFSTADLNRLAAEFGQPSVKPDLVVCTEKDMTKIQTGQLAGLPLTALAIEIEMREGDGRLEPQLEHIRQRILSAGHHQR